MAGTSLDVSSQSKEKSRASQLNTEQNAHQYRDGTDANVASCVNAASNSQVRNPESSARLSQSERRQHKCPRTPGEKIPFADLIANPEDAFNREIIATPNEQVEWRHVPGSSNTVSSVPGTQKSRKRALSSSPSSSVGRQTKRYVGDRNALDLESISRSLRTPKQDDPLRALWDRYADENDGIENQEPILPPLPPPSSSPHTPGGLFKSDGLRRTASCGIEWPVSTTKRRKLDDKDPYSRAKGIFAANKGAILGRDNPKHSRVSVLVNSIRQSLVHNTIPEETPASSSPLPNRHGEFQGSPLKQAQFQVSVEAGVNLSAIQQAEEVDLCERSSDYGGAEFDLDDAELLDVLEQTTGQPATVPLVKPMDPNVERSATPVHAICGPDVEHEQARGHSLSTVVEEEHSPRDDFGDFEDDDDEVFTTELAELANKVDSQNITGSVAAKPNATSNRHDDNPNLPPDIPLDEFDDAFDEDDDNDDLWKEIDHKTTQLAKPGMESTSQKNNTHRTIKRYLVIDIIESHYNTAEGRKRNQKVLQIRDEKSRSTYNVFLRQSWYDTRCSQGSYVHLVGDFNSQHEFVVDDKDNMIILHPDHLISATTVADAFSCIRRAILQDRIKATSSAEAPQVYGHLIHEVFGEALKQGDWEFQTLRKIINNILPNYIESLYEIGVQLSDATEYIMGKMPELKAWASIFVNKELVSDASIRDRNGVLVPTAINKLLELEEHVWSPMYGLKGNIDATVQAQMRLPADKHVRTLTVPLELKTGKRDSNEMHRAQTALYTLLISDRYDINVTSGILYYLETSKTFRVEGVRNEIRHMIIQRNELACYVHDKLALPPMIKREHLCKKCYAQTSCFTYHKLIEDGDGESSGMKEIFTDAVSHLKQNQQEFFKKWDDLLTKEERDAMKFRRELWTMLSSEREAVGRCFSNVVIEPGSARVNIEGPKINKYTYSFVKSKTRSNFSFVESQITIGEPIVISDEDGHFALALGYVTNVRPTRITVAVDRRLHNARRKLPGFHVDHKQIFSAAMDPDEEFDAFSVSSATSALSKHYRIDKDEFANGMATARNNLIRIMEKDLFQARELRHLIVEQRPPTFKHTSTAYSLSGPASQQNINIDQRHAIEKVMSARDYALVLGMPGTGKTTTIAHIIRALVSQGKSVLLTSYTHTAVDNILLKIKDDNVPVLRLGALGKVHPDVQQFVDLGSIPKKSITELEESWTKSKVVATTCLGINHAIFNHRKFDYCIVDEASQITLPVCLGPIRLASTFILVGDHYQLPPLVQNREAQEGGLDVSLFKLLSDSQPASVVTLEHQYRMAEDIMLLSNELIYDGRLKCGTSAVAIRTLQIPRPEAGIEAHHYTPSNMSRAAHPAHACMPFSSSLCWLRKALQPSSRTLLLNTDTISSQLPSLGAPEIISGGGNRITNPTEATITAQLLTTLIRSGVAPRSIGVITFYRSQLALLKSTIRLIAGSDAASDVEMHTADKYQGRDKEVILLSCVRSNEACNVGELLKDWRRVNVALTRARSKLVIIGSVKTLKGSGVGVLEGMIDIVMRKGWITDLSPNAMDEHFFEGSGTQTQASQQLRGKPSEAGESSLRKTSASQGRKVLGDVNGNTIAKRTANGGLKQPAKVFGRTLDINVLLDERPIMRNVLDGMECANFG